MFAKPRIKRNNLPPLNIKRKNTSETEEVSFDNAARQEYLTGFRKRKQQRIKNAQEAAAKRARQEKLETRKQVRDQRHQEMEDHVRRVNEMLTASHAVTADTEDSLQGQQGQEHEWDGFPDKPDLNIVNHEEEYIDEDRYTTVTVESVSVTRDGLSKPEILEKGVEEENRNGEVKEEDGGAEILESRRPSKPKKKQFRYESKAERYIENRKQRASNIRKRRG